MTDTTPIDRALCCGQTCGRGTEATGPCVAATYGRSRRERLEAAGYIIQGAANPTRLAALEAVRDATAALCRLLRIPEWAGEMNYEYITQGDLADRLALARALVPEMAVVPLEPLPELVAAWWRSKNTGGSDYDAYRAIITATLEPVA